VTHRLASFRGSRGNEPHYEFGFIERKKGKDVTLFLPFSFSPPSSPSSRCDPSPSSLFGGVRAIYWSKDAADLSPIAISTPIKVCLYACVTGILSLGLFPEAVIHAAMQAVSTLKI
jgi:hypothetical protein